jgi:GTPase SAR1 family protein
MRRFISNIFSDAYISTVGVKVEKKEIWLENGEVVTLLIWDFEGRDDLSSLAESYLRGMSGYFLVADGTRKTTLDSAINIHGMLPKEYACLPFALLLNKADLTEAWEITEEDYRYFSSRNIDVRKTSAKEGSFVEEAFLLLADKMTAAEGVRG